MQLADTWYGIEAYPDNIIRLRESNIDPYWSGSIWLVKGSERNLVVDTGTGIVAPAPIIESISDKPALAVALSSYYDHAGGLYSFEHRFCHHLEASDLIDPPVNWNNFIAENRLIALPYADYDFKSYSMKGTEPTQLLADGEIIDLGNRQLEIIHIPGRTPGSIALYEKGTGYLFGGESVFIDPDYRDFRPQNIAQYENSLTKLSELSINKVFGGHYGTISPAEFKQLVKTEFGRYQ